MQLELCRITTLRRGETCCLSREGDLKRFSFELAIRSQTLNLPIIYSDAWFHISVGTLRDTPSHHSQTFPKDFSSPKKSKFGPSTWIPLLNNRFSRSHGTISHMPSKCDSKRKSTAWKQVRSWALSKRFVAMVETTRISQSNGLTTWIGSQTRKDTGLGCTGPPGTITEASGTKICGMVRLSITRWKGDTKTWGLSANSKKNPSIQCALISSFFGTEPLISWVLEWKDWFSASHCSHCQTV